MPDNTQSTNDNPQDVIDQVLGGGEEPKNDVGKEVEKEIDEPKPEIKIPEKEEQMYEAHKMPAELITPPATSIPAEPGKPELAPPPPVAPPKPLPTQNQMPKPEILVKEPVPLAFAGAAPTPGVAPELGGISESGKVSPATAPSVAPAGVKPSGMVEPKKKGGKKALKVIAGLVILLVTVVGGLYGYAYLNGEKGSIASLDEWRERRNSRPTDVGDRVVRSGSGSTVDNQNYERNTAVNNSGRGDDEEEEASNNAWQEARDKRDAEIAAEIAAGTYETLEEQREREREEVYESANEAGNVEAYQTIIAGQECVGKNEGEYICTRNFTRTEGSLAGNNAVVCDGSGGYSEVDLGDACAPIVENGGSCVGLNRQSDGESHNGSFVGCFVKETVIQNCFCPDTSVPLGGGFSSGTVTCENDYANDSCGRDFNVTTGVTTSSDTPGSIEPPVVTPALACTSLIKDVAVPVIGDELTFTCAGSVVPAGATTLAYDFRYRRDAGEWFDLTTTGTTSSFTIALAGNYEVQCRACGTISNASVCDPSWIGAGL